MVAKPTGKRVLGKGARLLSKKINKLKIGNYGEFSFLKYHQLYFLSLGKMVFVLPPTLTAFGQNAVSSKALS